MRKQEKSAAKAAKKAEEIKKIQDSGKRKTSKFDAFWATAKAKTKEVANKTKEVASNME